MNAVRGMKSAPNNNAIARKNEVFDRNLSWTKNFVGNEGRVNALEAARLTRQNFDLHKDAGATPYENPIEYISDLLDEQYVKDGYIKEGYVDHDRAKKVLARLNEDGEVKLNTVEQRLLDKGRTGKLPFGKQPEIPEDSALGLLLDEERRGHISEDELKTMLAWGKEKGVAIEQKAAGRETLAGTTNKIMSAIETPRPPEDLLPPPLPQPHATSFEERESKRNRGNKAITQYEAKHGSLTESPLDGPPQGMARIDVPDAPAPLPQPGSSTPEEVVEGPQAARVLDGRINNLNRTR